MKYCLVLLLLAGCGSGNQDETLSEQRDGVILSLGDSISIGYRQYLELDAPIVWVGENCRSSGYTLANIDKWLEPHKNIKYIIWNNGAWDVLDNVKYKSSDIQYEANLRAILAKLQSRAPVIFLNTTFFPANTDYMFAPARVPDINDVAKRVMNENNVPIINMYAKSLTMSDYYINKNIGDDPHFTNEGYEILARFIEASIAGLQ